MTSQAHSALLCRVTEGEHGVQRLLCQGYNPHHESIFRLLQGFLIGRQPAMRGLLHFIPVTWQLLQMLKQNMCCCANLTRHSACAAAAPCSAPCRARHAAGWHHPERTLDTEAALRASSLFRMPSRMSSETVAHAFMLTAGTCRPAHVALQLLSPIDNVRSTQRAVE